MIDVALYEAVFNCMESLLPEYSAFGAVRGPAGSALPGIAPSNAYACTDGWVLVAGNGPRSVSYAARVGDGWVTAPGGVWVYSIKGELIGKLTLSGW